MGKLLPAAALAAPGSPSAGFHQSVLGDVYAIAEQADGRILVGGNLYYQNGRARSQITRCHPDGSPDSSFQVTTNGTVHGIILDPQGRIYISGSFSLVNGQTRQGIARLLVDGTLDSSFDPQFSTPGFGSCMAMQTDGHLLLGMPQRGVARISPAGVVDASFAVTLTGTPWTLCPQSDGSVIVGGDITILNGSPASHLARLLPDGTTDSSWTCAADNVVYSVVPVAQGNLLVGGSFSTLGGVSRSRLGRVSSVGVVDATFNPVPNNVVRSILPLANGQTFVGGSFSSIGGASRTGVACLNSSGTADTAWTSTCVSSVYALCLRRSGGLLVGRLRFIETTYGQYYPSLYAFDGGSFTSQLQSVSPGNVSWTRDGCAGDLLTARLDASADHGATWTSLGTLSKTANTWQAATGALADGTLLRAQGYVTGGYGASSGQWVQEYLVIGSPAPEVRVTVEGGSELTDATGTLSFSTAKEKKRLIIENIGSTPLILGNPRLSSRTAFRLDLQSFQPLLAPGASTTVDVEFDLPISGGNHSASLTLPSNDSDEAVFDIALTGTATLAGRADISTAFLEWVEPGASAFSKALVADGFHGDWLSYTMEIPANLMQATLWLYTDYGQDFRIGYSVNGKPATTSNTHIINLSRAATQVVTVTVIAADGVTARSYEFTLNRKAATIGNVNLDFQAPQSNASEVKVIAPQPDGHFMLSGSFSSMGGQQRLGMAKITPQGEVVNGFVSDQAAITCFQTAEDGSMLASGDRYGSQRGYARILKSGQRDPGLPSFAGPNFSQFAAILPDGDGFLMSGSFLVLNEPASYNLCRFGWDGRRDVTFTPSTPSYSIWAMAKLPDGRLLVSRASGNGAGLFVHNRFGDSVAVHGVTGSARCILPLPEGGFLLGGDLIRSGFTPLVRLKPDLTPDPAFNVSTALQGTPSTLTLQADGKILVGGCSMTAGSGRVRSTHVVRLLPNGQQDTSFSTEVEGTSLPVSSLTLRKDGQLLVGGRFTAINGVTDASLALLHNDPATETLELTSREQVTWLRGGSSPEAMRTQFSLSRDGGSTWTDLGAGQRISGGWKIVGLSLPAAGRIRALAHISVGANNASTGIMESTQDYNFEGEEITVVDDNAQGLAPGAALDFGQVGTTLGAQSSVSITVRNAGSLDLTGLSAVLSGAALADYTIQSPLPASLAPGASSELTLIFTPKVLGARQAAVTLHSSDGDEPSITFILQGTGVVSSTFSVVTGATKQVTAGSAVLQGTAKANGISRQVFFDYGPTSALGQSVAATPDTATGTATVNASATIDGLRPGFTYYYRIRGGSSLGNAIGTTRTFRTLTSPVPTGIQVSGTTQVSPEGAQLTLQVTAPEQAWWGVTGLPAWITTTLPASPGSASLLLKVLPNTGAAARQVKLVVGGVPVTITQTAVSAKPMITPDHGFNQVEANEIFAQQITVTGQPATLSVKGLPPGLTFSADGWVRGNFDQEGSFTTTITAKNGRGTTTAEWRFEVVRSNDLYYSLSGSYIALVERDPVLNRNLASRLDLTVTTTGGYSGKLTTGSTSVPFAGRLVMNTDNAYFAAALPVSGAPLQLTGTFPYQQDSLRLRLQTMDGSRVYFFLASKTTPTTMPATYSANLALTHSQNALNIPFGSGYLTCTATKTSKNMVLCTGRLGDGTALTFSTPLAGRLHLYYSLPLDGGTLAGVYLQGTSNTATWLKLAPSKPQPQDAYASGFGPVDLTIQGGAPPVMTPGGVRPGANAVLSFTHSSLNVTETSFTVPFQVVNPSTKGLTNTAKFTAATNPNTVAMPTYNPVTGAFTGTFTLKGATAAANRKVTFQGLLVPVGTGFVGHGYFMLPASTAKNAPQTSGRVTISTP